MVSASNDTTTKPKTKITLTGIGGGKTKTKTTVKTTAPAPAPAKATATAKAAATTTTTNAKPDRNSARLYVGRLNNTISQLSLKAYFSKFGRVLQVDKPGENFGFVQFQRVEDAKQCLNTLGKSAIIHDIRVVVQPAQVSTGGRGGDGGGGGGQQRRGPNIALPKTPTGAAGKFGGGWRSGIYDNAVLKKTPGSDDWKDDWKDSSLRASLDRDGPGASRFSGLLGNTGDFGYDLMKGPDIFVEPRAPSYGSLSRNRDIGLSSSLNRDIGLSSSLNRDIGLSSSLRDNFGPSRSSFGPPASIVQDLQDLKGSIQLLMKENAKLRDEKEEILMQEEMRKPREGILLERLQELQQENEEYKKKLNEYEDDHQALRETIQMANENLRTNTPDYNRADIQERLMMLDSLREEAAQQTEQNWPDLQSLVRTSLNQVPQDLVLSAAGMNFPQSHMQDDSFGGRPRIASSNGPGGQQQRTGGSAGILQKRIGGPAGAAGIQQRLGGRVKLPGGAGRQMGK